jgi:hypothetical protein
MDLQIATNHEKKYLDFNIMYFIFHIWANQRLIFLTFIKAGIIIRNLSNVLLICPQENDKKKLTIRFFIWAERFIFKINKKDTCLVDKFNSPSINQKIYNKKRISFTRKKKQMEEEK